MNPKRKIRPGDRKDAALATGLLKVMDKRITPDPGYKLNPKATGPKRKLNPPVR